MYGIDKITIFLNDLLKQYLYSYYKSNTEKNQCISSTDFSDLTKETALEHGLNRCVEFPVKNLISAIEERAPLFKHDFWKEEKEIRAVISVDKDKINSLKIIKDAEDYCFDLFIHNSCIKSIILGPEFTNDDTSEIIEMDNKIDLSQIKTRFSNGKDIIRSNK